MAAFSSATTKWLKYFADAGIPSNATANYAVIFTENRIQPDMLLDLNKEYLYDMGIRVMGDVIAILRYARTAYTQEAQQKILGEPSPEPKPTPKEIPENTPPKSSAVSRLVNHYTRRPAQPLRNEYNNSPVKNDSQTAQVKKVVSLKRTTTDFEENPRPKKTVRMQPNPNVMKTKESAKLTAVKGSVFRRLGESSVSSSTDTLGTVEQLSTSIFKRLGPSASGSESYNASSTVNDSPKSLQYRGVFKTNSPKKPISFASTREIPKTKVVLKKSMPTKTITTNAQILYTARSRLGLKPASSNVSTTTANQNNFLVKRSLMAVGLQQPKQTNIIKLSNNTNEENVKKKICGMETRENSFLRRSAFQNSLSIRKTSTPQRIVKSPSKPTIRANVFDRLGPLDQDL